MAVVTQSPEAVISSWREGIPIPPQVEIMGIVTFKDVLEKMLQCHIADEHDTEAPQRGEFIISISLKYNYGLDIHLTYPFSIAQPKPHLLQPFQDIETLSLVNPCQSQTRPNLLSPSPSL